jgi:SAM-dependent methyltransferase
VKDAAYYDEVYRGQYHVDEGRVQVVADLCRGKVLDIGCGDGVLAEHCDSYLGLDFSQAAIDLARKRNHGSEFLLYDFLADVGDDLPAGPWDTIVLGELLEHIDGGAQTMLFRKIKAVLADAGTVVATTPNGSAIPDEAHIRTFTLEQMRASLRLFGSVCTHGYSDKYVIASAHRAGRPKLSVVLIVKNEEELLPACLESLKGIWDELVIVDTGSTDKTVEIARSFGARIGHFPWQDDFAAARNYAESLCFGEYLYWQDGDEILLEGKDAIREIVEKGEADGVAPMLIFKRDATGAPQSTFIRQELLHKNNGAWRWHGAAHNWLNGPIRTAAPQIVVEHLSRPSGDRPNHTDIFDALRANCDDPAGPIERSLFYLAREHFYKKHYHETIALIAQMLQTPVSWPVQRSRGCIIAGDCWRALGNQDAAAQAYLRAISECPVTAEPFFCLGNLRYDQQKWAEAAAWFKASTMFEPGGFFCDLSIYEWRRYDLLARCLYRVGRKEEARLYGAKALMVRPDQEHLKKNMAYYTGAGQDASGTH